jgi:hypothetical protein
MSRFPVLLAFVVAGAATAGACSSEPAVKAPATSVTSAATGATTSTAAVPAETLPPVPPIPAVGSLARDADPLVVFVDPAGGDDGNDGQTSTRAWRSLQVAVDRLGAGMTLYLLDGEYQDAIKPGTSHFVLTNSGTADAWIRVRSAPGHEPVIVAAAGNGFEIRGSYVEVSGLTVRGEGFGTGNDYGWGLLTRSNHHVRLAGNTVSGMAVGGITSVEASNLEIVGNTVFENSFWGPEQGSGISLWRSRDHGTGPDADGYHDRIVGNVIYRNENKVFSMWNDQQNMTDGNGVIIDGTNDFGYSGRILVANNLIFDNGGRGVLVLLSSKVDVIHNTTYHNGRTELLEGGPTELAAGRSSSVRFLNNLAWSLPGAPPLRLSEATAIESGGNVFVTDVESELHSELDTVVESDPGLVNPSVDPDAADFRPSENSLLLDRALSIDPPLVLDGDNSERPLSGADVGAFEG